MSNDSWPKIAVMGAGAVGSYYGAVLARAGADVTLIGRAQHVEAVARKGLRLETAGGTQTIAVSARADSAAVRDARWILFCVKSIDTEAAARAIAPHLARDAVVLSLQNGVDNIERMRPHIDKRLIPAVVYVAAAITAPGCVRHSGRGDLIIGEPQQPAGQNDAGAELAGIDVAHIYAVTFGLGTACLAIAACLLIPTYYVNPQAGNAFVLIAFTIVVLGGMGSVTGALIGGLFVGVVESLSSLYLGESLGQIGIFAMFILVLLFRPSGLFGERA